MGCGYAGDEMHQDEDGMGTGTGTGLSTSRSSGLSPAKAGPGETQEP